MNDNHLKPGNFIRSLLKMHCHNLSTPVAMNLQVDNDHDPSSEICKSMLRELQTSSMSRIRIQGEHAKDNRKHGTSMIYGVDEYATDRNECWTMHCLVLELITT